MLAFYRRPFRLALSLALFFVVAGVSLGGTERRLLQRRSFFGVYTVTQIDGFRTLRHGTTTHGAQSVDPAVALEQLTYYHRLGPIAQVLGIIGSAAPRRVAIVGLGTGSLACYGRPNESWTFYEIDPLVVRIARDPAYFTYMRDCPPAKRVILGDARLALANAPAGSYDILVVDAFASDAIPTHLITREALRLYLEKLVPGGVVAFHISNRYLNPWSPESRGWRVRARWWDRTRISRRRNAVHSGHCRSGSPSRGPSASSGCRRGIAARTRSVIASMNFGFAEKGRILSILSCPRARSMSSMY